MAYNVVYTSIPVMVTAVLDKDIEEKSVLEHPEILYICQTGRYMFFVGCFCTLSLSGSINICCRVGNSVVTEIKFCPTILPVAVCA